MTEVQRRQVLDIFATMRCFDCTGLNCYSTCPMGTVDGTCLCTIASERYDDLCKKEGEN